MNERRWWKQKRPEDMYPMVFAEVRRIENSTIDRQQSILDAAALYGELGPWPGYWGVAKILPGSRRISHNVIATAVDALVAEVTQSVPRPMAVTIGGTYNQRRRAMKLTKYWEAKFDDGKVQQLARQCVRDAILSGMGYLRAYRKNPSDPKRDSVGIERLYPSFIVLDDRNCVDVPPRQIYFKRFIDKSHLQDCWPEYEDDIEKAQGPDQTYWFSFDADADIVEVIEAFSLASDDGETPGKHVLCVSSAVLHEEEFSRNRFPGSFITAVPPQIGFWGEPLVRRAAPAQLELNKLLRRVQESMHLHAIPRVFLPRQAGVVQAHMQNEIGIMCEYDGPQAPSFFTPASMGRDVYDHIVQLERWIYKELGVSELSASSTKPAGLDSGAALRTFGDVQSRRWINLQRAYEDLIVDVAWECARLESEIADEYKAHEVSYATKKYFRTTKWKDIELPEDKMLVRVFPVSALPSTPAGKLQALEEMVKNQVITPEVFFQMIDDPDFDQVRELTVAPRELLESQFDSMLEGGAFIRPEPYQDLILGRMLASLMIQKAELEGAEEADVDKLREWITMSLDIESWINQDQQKQAMEAAAAESPQPLPGANGMDMTGIPILPTAAPVPSPYGE